MLRFLDWANALTMLSFTCALACAVLAIRQQLAFALVALIASGLGDLFDGAVARRLTRTDEQRRFGSRLDSLVDVCAFGFAPAVLLFSAGLTTPVELLVLFLFAACAVWRLAYFDTVTHTGQAPTFHEGLPTTYVALVLPLVLLAGLWWPAGMRSLAVGAALVLAVAMVSPVRVPKPRAFAYVVFLIVGVSVILALLILGVSHGQSGES